MNSRSQARLEELSEAVVEAERILDEVTERHVYAQTRVTKSSIELQKALTAYTGAHNEYQFARSRAEGQANEVSDTP